MHVKTIYRIERRRNMKFKRYAGIYIEQEESHFMDFLYTIHKPQFKNGQETKNIKIIMRSTFPPFAIWSTNFRGDYIISEYAACHLFMHIIDLYIKVTPIQILSCFSPNITQVWLRKKTARQFDSSAIRYNIK